MGRLAAEFPEFPGIDIRANDCRAVLRVGAGLEEIDANAVVGVIEHAILSVLDLRGVHTIQVSCSAAGVAGYAFEQRDVPATAFKLREQLVGRAVQGASG